jgi:hypothetical protein
MDNIEVAVEMIETEVDIIDFAPIVGYLVNISMRPRISAAAHLIFSGILALKTIVKFRSRLSEL